ncbi:hypothetical protein Aperf_G00000007114 [Anoplocephala perfoliata]
MDPRRRVPLFQITDSQQNTSTVPQQQQQQFQYPNEDVVKPMPVVQIIPTSMPVGNQQPLLHSVTPSTSSSAAPSIRRPFGQLSEREMRKRIKKQKLERRRRANITDKLSTVHKLAVSLVGGNENHLNQKTEITEKLDQCANVMEFLTEVVNANPDLKAKIQRPDLLSMKSSERSRRHGGPCDVASTSREEAKENIPSPLSASTFIPISTRHSSVPTTSPTLMLHGTKRESTDSGLEQSQPSISNLSLPRTSTSSVNEDPSPKRPRESPLPKIWRPYRE